MRGSVPEALAKAALRALGRLLDGVAFFQMFIPSILVWLYFFCLFVDFFFRRSFLPSRAVLRGSGCAVDVPEII